MSCHRALQMALLLVAILTIPVVQCLHPPPVLSKSYVRWLAGKPCPYAADPATAVQTALQREIVAQDDAIAAIVARFRRWREDAMHGEKYPLVLSLTGTTGVGKTTAARVIASSLCVARRGDHPEGLLLIDGSGVIGMGGTVGEAKRSILSMVAQSLYECGGHTILVVDEAQKTQHGVLSVLSPLLSGRSAHLSFTDSNGKMRNFDATEMVIIFISDIGSAEARQYMANASIAAREAVRASGGAVSITRELTRRLRAALAAREADIGINLATVANAAVPLLPLNQLGVQAVIRKELERIVVRPSPFWDVLTVEQDKLAVMLSDRFYTLYDKEAEKHFKDVPAAAADGMGNGASRAGATAKVQPDGSAQVEGGGEDSFCAQKIAHYVFASGGARAHSKNYQDSPMELFISTLEHALGRYRIHEVAPDAKVEAYQQPADTFMSLLPYPNQTVVGVSVSCSAPRGGEWIRPTITVSRCVHIQEQNWAYTHKHRVLLFAKYCSDVYTGQLKASKNPK